MAAFGDSAGQDGEADQALHFDEAARVLATALDARAKAGLSEVDQLGVPPGWSPARSPAGSPKREASPPKSWSTVAIRSGTRDRARGCSYRDRSRGPRS
ncbi:hypothetical protein [Amycolatopsis sp. cmx-11-51]|uniref:hypothetical protein n=1 Tax=Amycolatopsis sp. cmx-11-51 TaxID=2785797 RepID=UPI0039E5DDAB